MPNSINAQISMSSLPIEGLTPKSEFLLVPRTMDTQFGIRHTFSDSELRQMVIALKALGHPLVIDYEHQTMASTPGFERFASPDGKAPAAGWIGGAEVRPDGIWATGTTWTVRATELLKNGEYRFYSPVIYWAGKMWDSAAFGLGPVALTNDPQITGLQALAARFDYSRSESTAGAPPRSKFDHVSESQAFRGAPPEVRALHLDACAYAETHGCDYTQAICRLTAAGR